MKQVSESTGYTRQHLLTLKKRFQSGWDCKTYDYTHKAPANKTPAALCDKIVNIYVTKYADYNFQFYCDCLEEFEGIKISYNTLAGIMKEYGVVSPCARRKKRKGVVNHRERLRRQNEGDMIQLDGTPFPWFQWCGDREYYSLMGAIDDATGKIVGLYMCENECLHGYNEVMRQCFSRYGKPRCAYTDKAGIFCKSPQQKFKLTLEEQLAGLHESRTQWQRELNQLGIVQILAHSPQAKGRVERMWGTIQGRLPALLKRFEIHNIKEANQFLESYFIDYFNRHFSKTAAVSEEFWVPVTENLDDILCARFMKKTKRYGSFKFQGYNFVIVGLDRCTNISFDFCISERGIYADVDGKHYDVDCTDWLTDAKDEIMPLCTRNILHEYLFKDMKESAA